MVLFVIATWKPEDTVASQKFPGRQPPHRWAILLPTGSEIGHCPNWREVAGAKARRLSHSPYQTTLKLAAQKNWPVAAAGCPGDAEAALETVAPIAAEKVAHCYCCCCWCGGPLLAEPEASQAPFVSHSVRLFGPASSLRPPFQRGSKVVAQLLE